ncbi:MAG TPA: serine/threonine-protein kinase [Vicinamibacterales bacterium]|nr:serine/threonine-protein kinase [Vicinamibacterales bacterium]
MSDRWERVGALFDQALSRPTEERDAIVDASGEPPDVREEVQSLLAAHAGAGEFLEQPATAAVRDVVLSSGTLVGPYRIDAVLGRGGMGVVYAADDTRLHRRVALKWLSPDVASQPHQRERLRREARATAALDHPGIATVYALEEFDAQLFIASEYLDGETLRVELDRGALPAATAHATALEVARALCAAHEGGIVHRDLKPENVLRTTSGRLKILDFGLAQFHEAARDLLSRPRLTEPGIIAGTPPYMSPEQLLGRDTDFRSDHFAFGILLYELYTGRHPFGGRSLPSTIAQILAAEPQHPGSDGHMPAAVWAIVEQCLKKDPVQRFPATRALINALERGTLSGGTLPGGTLSGGTFPEHVPSTQHLALSTLKWWRFHQFAAAMAYWSMVWPVWHIHGAVPRVGLLFFFATLAAVVAAGTLRLHLWFSSRVYPEDLAEQRADVAPWIRAADIIFCALLIIGGIALPAGRAGWAAVLISFGIGSALAFLFIEPATARAAFRKAD